MALTDAQTVPAIASTVSARMLAPQQVEMTKVRRVVMAAPFRGGPSACAIDWTMAAMMSRVAAGCEGVQLWVPAHNELGWSMQVWRGPPIRRVESRPP
jgi:hypothetical protein